MFSLPLNTEIPNFIAFLNFYLGKAASFFAKKTLPNPAIPAVNSHVVPIYSKRLKLRSTDLPNKKTE